MINPMQFAEELESFVDRGHIIPNFILGKYMVLDVAAPRGKTKRDGLVLHCALLSYKDKNGEDVEMIQIEDGISGLDVTFPNGKRGITATKYRGPKSIYKYVEDGKWKQISNSLMTIDAAEEYCANNVEGWDTFSLGEKDFKIDEYLESFYSMGLRKDLDLPDNVNPKPGMVVELYRRYTPPVGDEKYGNTIITKWAQKEQMPNLDGSYIEKDTALAKAILTALRTPGEATFDPSEFA